MFSFAAFNTGKGLLAGASVMGLGALCYYGVGMSNQVGAIDKAMYVILTLCKAHLNLKK